MEPPIVTQQPEHSSSARKRFMGMRERPVQQFEAPKSPNFPISAALEPEKKQSIWLQRVTDCLTSVATSFFQKQELDEDSDEEFFINENQILKEELIGAGAQGRVYKGKLYNRSGKNLQTVAIKCVSTIDDRTLRHLRSIKHENLVHTIGVCVDASNPFLVIELCANGSLYEYLHSSAQISPVQVVSWLTGIARGMLHLHTKKIIHRDLKSPNVLMVNDFDLKVSDFGTCRNFDVTSDIKTFAGTISWMAPEVIRHEKYTQKADVWSFGVVVWEVVTRQVPYVNLEQYSILWGVGNNYITLPMPKTVPRKLAGLMQKCQIATQRDRPDFAKVLSLLYEAEPELTNIPQSRFQFLQNQWALEAHSSMMNAENQFKQESACQSNRVTRMEYKKQKQAAEERLHVANELFMEVASMRLQLEKRESDLVVNEKIAQGLKSVCTCCKRTLKMQRQISSSSDTKEEKPRVKPESKFSLHFNHGKAKLVKENCTCNDIKQGSEISKDHLGSKMETIVTKDGKVQAAYGSLMSNKRKQPDIADV